MAKKNDLNQLNLTVVALVALVAIVGLVALVLNAGSIAQVAGAQVAFGSQLASASDDNLAGEATLGCVSRCLGNGGDAVSCQKQCQGGSSGSGGKFKVTG